MCARGLLRNRTAEVQMIVLERGTYVSEHTGSGLKGVEVSHKLSNSKS